MMPRPRARPRETLLLAVVGLALLVGWVSLRSTEAGRWTVGDPRLLGLYLAALLVVHVCFILAGRRTDELLFPVVGLLGGLSLLLMARLPQDLVVERFGGLRLGLAELQLLWLLIAFACITLLAVGVRGDGWLRRYKYTWAAGGIALLLLVFVLGRVVNGARLSMCIGPVCGQPSELLKVVLVIFLAGYLADNRALLAGARTRLGPLQLPPLPYLVPMLAMWGLALAVVIVQRDLGAALLYFTVFLAIYFTATRRLLDVAVALAGFLAGSYVLYRLFGYVQVRVDIWLNPFADPNGAGYQTIRALYAFGRGGILGTGLGAGLPSVGAVPDNPEIQSDFIFAALGEELGLLGALAVLMLFLVLAERGLRIALASGDDFRALLATGLTLVIVVQAAIIIGGNIKVVPLTGITLPFVSYGGSSLLTNAIVVGLLLALSERTRTAGPGLEPGS